MKPRIPITSPDFIYRNSASTDLAKTFARIRREMKEREAQEATVEQFPKVRALTKVAK